MTNFTKEEKEILKKYFSSITSDIFCIVNLPEVIKGTLFSRYSRTAKSVRRLFLDEFYNGEISGLFKGKTEVVKEKAVDTSKAEDFYERILVGYGDDSVAELGGVHIALENISNIAVKLVEDARIGISPLEKSSRYVFYDRKVNGKYMYYRDKKIVGSIYGKKYEELMDHLFDTYALIVREIYNALTKEGKPETASDVAFKASCRAKACDVARYLLPMGTHTNVGLFGNGRAFEYLLIKLQASPFPETTELAKKMVTELKKVVGAFIKRSYNPRGTRYVEYLKNAQEAMYTLAQKKVAKITKAGSGNNAVRLVSAEKDALDKVVTGLLFPYAHVSHNELYKKVQGFSDKAKEHILKTARGNRENRHHKMPRGFEQAHYTFEITSDIGAYRDVQRHRMLSQQRQAYTTDLGYTVPEELLAFPILLKKYETAMKKANKLYQSMKKKMPYEAQYVVPFGYKINYYFTLNLREAVHFSELRSISQGHPSYRYIAQEIARQITKKHPLLSKYAFSFVDYKSYKLDRLEAFEKIAQKASSLGMKAFQE